jgi:hypothetical protein
MKPLMTAYAGGTVVAEVDDQTGDEAVDESVCGGTVVAEVFGAAVTSGWVVLQFSTVAGEFSELEASTDKTASRKTRGLNSLII